MNTERLTLDWNGPGASMSGTRGTEPVQKLRVRDAHLVGIGGSGMRALAEFLGNVGVRVTGSDASLKESERWRFHLRGLRVCAGHAEANLPDESNLVVYSPAIPEQNVERQAARRLGIPQFSLPQALGWLMRMRSGISVCGTHGKTTTTALVGHLLDEAGWAPSVICGGEVRGREASGWSGRGPTIVVESCEYRRHFLELTPRHAVLLNIEPDHFDCFPTLESATAAYAEFVGRLPRAGLLVVNGDCQHAMEAARNAVCPVTTFGRGPSVDWRIVNRTATKLGWSFVIEHRGTHIARFRLPGPVAHNVENAAAAIALGHSLGIPRHRLQAGLRTFSGVRRRFECVGQIGGVMLLDDYAHHPTAIRSVLRTVRQRYSGRRLWCAFQPHQVSRTRSLMKEFADSLRRADEVLVAPVFAAREIQGVEAIECSESLARCVRRTGGAARFVSSLDEIRRTIETEARPGDLFVTLGAGDIDSIARGYSRRPARRQAS